MTRHVDRADGGLRFANPPYDRAFMDASPPMAAGHPGAHLGSVRLGGGGMVRAIIQARRYLRRQVSNSRHRLKRLRRELEMGPCVRRGLRGESANLYPRKVRIPGGCRGLLPKRCGASRTGLRRTPEMRKRSCHPGTRTARVRDLMPYSSLLCNLEDNPARRHTNAP